MVRHPDLIPAVFLMALGAAAYQVSGEIPLTTGVTTFSPRFFPVLASVGMFLCGIGLLGHGLVAPRAPLPFMFNRANFYVAALFCAYFLTFEFVDFRVGAWAVTIACMWVLGARNRVQLAITPVATALVIYGLFRHAFEVVLPTWI